MGKKNKSSKNKNNNNNNKKKNNRNNNNNNRKQQQQQQLLRQAEENHKKDKWNNFVSEAGPGCYIVRRQHHEKHNNNNNNSINNHQKDDDNDDDWILEWEDIDPDEFVDDDDEEEDDVPDVAIDIEERTLSFCNIDNITKVAYITVYETKLRGKNGRQLKQGITTDNNGISTPCITFIVLCPPHVFIHLCYLDINNNNNNNNNSNFVDITQTRIESDVQEWNRHPNPTDEHPMSLGFPLSDENGPYLCTQGINGELTHFFSGNLHAIDFRCPIGTPLLAVANGIVIESNDKNTLSGIAVSNLFEWNSIIIKVDDDDQQRQQNENNNNKTAAEEEEGRGEKVGGPLFVEYVHIQKSFVKMGDTVKRGDIIGTSGSVGFSPEPHLHFTAFRSSDPVAPTVGIKFQQQQQQQQRQKSIIIDNQNEDCQVDDNNNNNDSSEATTTTSSSSSLFVPQAGLLYNSTGEVKI